MGKIMAGLLDLISVKRISSCIWLPASCCISSVVVIDCCAIPQKNLEVPQRMFLH